MPDMYFDVDAALGEVPVNLMPLLDDTDFKTRETAIAYNASGMDLVWNFVTSAGAFTQTAVTPTTAGTYDWTHQGDGIYTIEIPASGGASINNDTEGYGWFSGFVTGVLPWRGPVIGFRAAAINDALCDGGDLLDVNTTQIAGQTASASGTVTFPNATLASTTNITAAAGCAVSSIGNNVITAASIAADAITDAKVASDVTIASVTGAVGSVTGAVGSVTGAVGSVTGNVGGNVVGSVASVTAGVTLANNAITAAATAADFTTEVTAGLSTLDAAGVRAAVGLASANLDTQLADLPTANENADALLARNVSGGSSAGRTVKQALHVLRNKTEIGAGTLTVYDVDDTTPSFTAAVTTTAGDPISAIDPA